MAEDMQQDAIDCATQALEKYNIERLGAGNMRLIVGSSVGGVSREYACFWLQDANRTASFGFITSSYYKHSSKAYCIRCFVAMK